MSHSTNMPHNIMGEVVLRNGQPSSTIRHNRLVGCDNQSLGCPFLFNLFKCKCMKKLNKIIVGVIAFMVMITPLLFLAPRAEAITSVKGYIKKNGTYVAPYFRSNKDSTKLNNYSTKGNVNLFTGKKGYVNPYKPSILFKKFK